MTNVITAVHDAVPPREPFSQNAESGLNRDIQTDAVDHQRADHLLRRLEVVWLDLGLDRTVPNGWVEASTDGLNFTSLTLRQANQLIRALEDLAVEHVPEVPEPGPGQLSFFDGDL
jgi:hypothetical protein